MTSVGASRGQGVSEVQQPVEGELVIGKRYHFTYSDTAHPGVELTDAGVYTETYVDGFGDDIRVFDSETVSGLRYALADHELIEVNEILAGS